MSQPPDFIDPPSPEPRRSVTVECLRREWLHIRKEPSQGRRLLGPYTNDLCSRDHERSISYSFDPSRRQYDVRSGSPMEWEQPNRMTSSATRCSVSVPCQLIVHHVAQSRDVRVSIGETPLPRPSISAAGGPS